LKVTHAGRRITVNVTADGDGVVSHAVDSRGLGSEIELLPNREIADADSLVSISHVRCLTAERALAHEPTPRRRSTICQSNAPRGARRSGPAGERCVPIGVVTCDPVRCPNTVGVRTQRLELRLTDEERSVDQAAAVAVGESLSDFFRRAAADVLTDQRKIALTEDEAIRFLDPLETVDDHAVARLAELRSRT
jgi:uncharacterized protein (DUF1778 family)